MEIQADMILHSALVQDTFDVEKGRVLAEIKQSYNRPSYHAENLHMNTVFGKTPYGFPTLGSENGIKSLSMEAVTGFHDDCYVANNMTLVLKGYLNFNEMEELAESVYGDEPAKKLPERPESWPEAIDS